METYMLAFCELLVHKSGCEMCFSILSVPRVQFREAEYRVDEADGQVKAMVYRSGDISQKSTVRCYTRQGSAQVMMDYNERPNTDASIITFLPGQQVSIVQSSDYIKYIYFFTVTEFFTDVSVLYQSIFKAFHSTIVYSKKVQL